MSVLANWLASPPPDAAIEIAADRVTAAVVTVRGDGPVLSAHASEALRPSVITPSLTGLNIQDRLAVTGALNRVVEKLGTRPRRIALVVPDTAAKISLLRFESVPPRRDDFEQLVRWQLRKATPFPVESAAVAWSPGAMTPENSREFIVELARGETIREYESLCEDAGLYAGLVDIATFSLLGLFAGMSGEGDWLLVHVRPDYASIAIVRDDTLIFYRNRMEDAQESLPDLVHQTAMYYQDRLAGSGFGRVYLAGAGRAPGAAETVRRGIEERLGIAVEPLDPTRGAVGSGRMNATPELMDAFGPPIGLLMRSHSEVGV